MSRMQSYATHCSDVETRTDKAKEEILKMIQGDTLEAVMNLSENEFERKNRDFLLIENFNRHKLYQNRKYQQSVSGVNGIWRDEGSRVF